MTNVYSQEILVSWRSLNKVGNLNVSITDETTFFEKLQNACLKQWHPFESWADLTTPFQNEMFHIDDEDASISVSKHSGNDKASQVTYASVAVSQFITLVICLQDLLDFAERQKNIKRAFQHARRKSSIFFSFFGHESRSTSEWWRSTCFLCWLRDTTAP